MTAVLNVVIIGFGRIGRLAQRSAMGSGRPIQFSAIVEPNGSPEQCANAFQYDSVHGRFGGEVSYGEAWVDFGAGRTKIINSTNPEDWDFSGVDIRLTTRRAVMGELALPLFRWFQHQLVQPLLFRKFFRRWLVVCMAKQSGFLLKMFRRFLCLQT